DRHAMREIAPTEGLDTALERLQPPRQPADDGVRAGGNGEEENHQDDRQAGTARYPGRQERPRHRTSRTAACAGPTGAARRSLPRAHGPQGAAVVERDPARGLALGRATQERLGGADSLAARIVEG